MKIGLRENEYLMRRCWTSGEWLVALSVGKFETTRLSGCVANMWPKERGDFQEYWKKPRVETKKTDAVTDEIAFVPAKKAVVTIGV
jgi:hypothetical protein